MDWDEVVKHTLLEEQEGKEVWEKLQAKELTCADLSDEQFGTLGEYFMGEMLGDSHAAMNARMIQMHGEEGEEEIHIAMGKQISGCDTSATPTNVEGAWMPMMGAINDDGSVSFFGNSLGHGHMGYWGYNSNLGAVGWFFMMFILWALMAFALLRFLRWLTKRNKSSVSPLDVLKERYARGDIDKETFEKMKKDLV